MCFGNTQTGSEQKNTTFNANPVVSGAATQNLNFAANLQNKGFMPYTNQQVAAFGPLQGQSFNMAENTATDPQYLQNAQALTNQYSRAPAQNVQTQNLAAGMSPFMSNYVQMALNPQLQQQQNQFDMQNKQNAAQATSSGAFGDQRAGIQQAQTGFNQDLARQGLIANAYNSAFNTALGGSAQQSALNQQAGMANAGYNEQALNRALGGAGALQGLQNQQLGVAGNINQLGQQQTAQSQAGLNAQYNQWLMAQQYPFQTAQLANQTLGAASQAMPASQSTTGTTSQPNNSGWATGGAILGGIGGSFLGMPGVGASLGSSLGGAFGNSMMNSGMVNPTAYTGGAGLPYG